MEMTPGTALQFPAELSIQRCPLCAKPIARASSYKRHVSYCRRAQVRPRYRHRSCSSCVAAKAKCSFEARCSRCVAKGLECSYEQLLGPNHLHTRPGEVIETSALPVSHQETDSASVLSESVEPGALDITIQRINDISDGSFGDAGVDSTFANDLVDDWHLDIEQSSFASPGEVPSSLTMEQVLRAQDPQYLTRRPASGLVAKQNAMLIIESLCAMPEQMLRRTTLPPFIHAHWHKPAMPEPLAVCMKIAQMFASRTPEITPFIWRTILSEQRRIDRKLHTLSSRELLAILQASMVYIMMRVVDGVTDSTEWNLEMTSLLNNCCDRFLELCGGKFNEEEQESPSMTWDDWIFAESRRRTSCVWFLFTRTILVKTKSGCPTNEQPWTLPLPAPKQQWEARTHDDWMEELLAGTTVLRRYGNLIDSKQRCDDRLHAQRLDSWNAKTDSLGALLNLAVAMV